MLFIQIIIYNTVNLFIICKSIFCLNLCLYTYTLYFFIPKCYVLCVYWKVQYQGKLAIKLFLILDSEIFKHDWFEVYGNKTTWNITATLLTVVRSCVWWSQTKEKGKDREKEKKKEGLYIAYFICKTKI